MSTTSTFGFLIGVMNIERCVWSLLRSWLRPHRGISQEKRPLDLAFFELIHNLRQRGKALFGSLLALLVKPSTRNRE